MAIGVGAKVRVAGLATRPDLNGRSAKVQSRDVKRNRWNVYVDGEAKKLSLREENLVPLEPQSDDDDFDPEPSQSASRSESPNASASRKASAGSKRLRGATTPAAGAPDMLAPKAKKGNAKDAEAPSAAAAASQPAASSRAVGKRPMSTSAAAHDADRATSRRCAANLSRSSGSRSTKGTSAMSAPGDQTRWAKKNRHASDAWEAALDAMQPQECEQVEEGAEAANTVTAAPAAAPPARDPRMRGFRIGGQTETEAERGEGWCGPWATASRLIEQREQAKLERDEAVAAGQVAPPPFVWTPRRDASTAPPRQSSFQRVPTLQEIGVAFLVEHIEAVASFGVLSPAVQHAVAARLGALRKFDDHALGLLTAADAGVTELVLPNCSLIAEDAMVAAFERLCEFDCRRLRLLDLGFCGRSIGPRAMVTLERFDALETLRLRGCFRVTTDALTRLLTQRGSGLSELSLSANAQLSSAAIAAIGAYCGTTLHTLRVEDCDQLPPEVFAPLRTVPKLQTLSLGGVCLLSDNALMEILEGCAPSLTSLCLRSCSLLTPDAIMSAARLCIGLRELDLEGVELITDDVGCALAESLPALERVVLKACVQLSDQAIVALADGCRGLTELSLNKLPAISDASLLALRTHCAKSFTFLDISWCRGVSDHGVGAFVDACEGLEKLVVWGCSHLTRTFYDGHSNDALRIVGRGVGFD